MPESSRTEPDVPVLEMLHLGQRYGQLARRLLASYASGVTQLDEPGAKRHVDVRRVRQFL